MLYGIGERGKFSQSLAEAILAGDSELPLSFKELQASGAGLSQDLCPGFVSLFPRCRSRDPSI